MATFQSPPPIVQLDLFEHSRDIMLRNDVVKALLRREPVAAEKALAVLSGAFSDDNSLMSLTELLAVLNSRPAPFTTHDQALKAVEHMETVVLPAAKRVFGEAEMSKWLVPEWRSLASSAEHLAFDPDHRRAHTAFMLLEAGDWAAAETSIKRIPSWRRIPATLAWMAEARFGGAGLEAAWPFLVELAWSNSELFSELARRLPDTRLRALLQRFSADLEGSGDQADFAWFPAWLLIEEPSFLPVFREAMQHDNTTPERCARTVMELLISERRGGQSTNLEHRRRLQALHPGLFARYKSTR
ncbi:MAG: hypothetical protein GEV05_23865 [Betaproteobacteria bacterium]|nr:hypothetical protein [Betaproteobacteria bacterium]